MNKKLHQKINCKNFIQLAMITVALVLSPIGMQALPIATSNSLFIAQFKGKKVTLKIENASIKKILFEIQKQTRINFVYNDAEIKDIPFKSIQVKGESLENTLNTIFSGTILTYKLSGNSISIVKREISKPISKEKVSIKGRIIDEENNPVSGASVTSMSTSDGAISDEKGNFVLRIHPESTFEISFIGFERIERRLKPGENNLVIRMKKDVFEVDDVVVTGYFNKKSSTFTGAASAFTGEELRQINPTNILSALSILDPSFKLVENIVDGSNPNVVPEFQIRGSNSMPNVKNEYEGNPNMPTFIMDGFEVTAEKVFDLDPTRIEMINILKDAAATAIYGSRASNGVVVITTRMPKKGTLRLSYNLDMSFSIPDLRDYDLLNAREKLELEKASGYYSSTIPHLLEEREAQYNYKLGLITRGYDTYWLNKPLEVAVGHKHSLNVEGGENSLRYSFDLSYDSAPGVMKQSDRERIGLSMLLQYQLKNVMFRNQISYDNVTSINSPYGSFSQYARANPYYAYTDEYGNYLYELESDKRGAFSNIPNPLYNTQLHTIDKSTYNSFINNFSIDWDILKGLKLKGNIAIRHKKEDATVFKPAKHTDFSTYAGDNIYRKGSYDAKQGSEFGYDANIVLTYFMEKNGHALSFNGAVNLMDAASQYYNVYVEGFPDENLDFITFGAQYHETRKPNGKDKIERLIGVVGNINYSYKDRYFIDFSGRTDASSKFGTNTRWAPFGSIGLGWNIHKEKFFENNLTFIDRLKIRGSLGLVGSQSFDPFQAIPKYEYDVNNRYRFGIGATMKGMANRDLRWQTTVQRNIGLDVDMFKRRFMVTFNYYDNISKSLLSDITLPPSLGFSSYTANVGEIRNKGLDFKVRGTVFRNKDGYLNISIGAMRNRNRLTKIANSFTAWNANEDAEKSNAPKVRFIEGQSLNTIWAAESMGINPANGKEVFIDRFGNRTDVWDSRDQKPMGTKDSQIEGNLSLSGGYKGIQVSLYMSYNMGGQTYNSTLVDRVENADKRYNCDRRVLEARWRKEGDITFFKDIQNGEMTMATSRFVQNYNYLQMSSASVSYDFSGSWMKKMRIQGMRLSFYMNDVFRWSTVKEERGLSYPFARSFKTSLKITF